MIRLRHNLSPKARDELRELDRPLMARMFPRSGYRQRRRQIFRKNAQDLQCSKRLAAALADLSEVDVVEMSVTEQQINGCWRPFRVEHTLSGSLRGECKGYMSHGYLTGVISPNVLESSSVLFLQNDDGKTLRALVPAQSAAREMLAQAVTAWADRAGYEKGWYGNSTHLGNVLHAFAMKRSWADGLAHTGTIDMLDASCQKAIGERPVVHVLGKQIQDGVALATALQVNGETKVLLPTNFFGRLAEAVERLGLIGNARGMLVPGV